MTSFLFIPATHDRAASRRVDFGNIGALFAESEEPRRHSGAWRGVLRMAAAVTLAILAIGDTCMMAHSAASGCLPAPYSAGLRSMF